MRVLVLVLSVIGTALALASDSIPNCDSPSNTVETIQCLYAEQQILQEQLDTLVADIRAGKLRDADDLAAFNEAHNNWAKYMETDCQSVHEHWKDGSIRGPLTIMCKIAHIEERNKLLTARYSELK